MADTKIDNGSTCEVRRASSWSGIICRWLLVQLRCTVALHSGRDLES